MKLTKKQVMDHYMHVIALDGDALGRLFAPRYRLGYTCGTCGVNVKIFHIDDYTAIARGSRPFGNIRPDRALIEKYEKKADAAQDADECAEILADFVTECKKQAKRG